MYNKNHECKYMRDNLLLEGEYLNENEMDYVRDLLYKDDLLQIFNIENENIETSNDYELNRAISKLHDILVENNELKQLMIKAASVFFSEDTYIGLCILYSYEYMYLTHPCVCDFLETATIMPENMEKLKNKLLM